MLSYTQSKGNISNNICHGEYFFSRIVHVYTNRIYKQCMNEVHVCSEYIPLKCPSLSASWMQWIYAANIHSFYTLWICAVHIHKCVRSAYTQMSAQWGRLYTVYISCIYSVYIVYKQCKYTQSSAEWGRLYAMHALVAPPFKASFG